MKWKVSQLLLLPFTDHILYLSYTCICWHCHRSIIVFSLWQQKVPFLFLCKRKTIYARVYKIHCGIKMLCTTKTRRMESWENDLLLMASVSSGEASRQVMEQPSRCHLPLGWKSSCFVSSKIVINNFLQNNSVIAPYFGSFWKEGGILPFILPTQQ